MLPGQNCGPSRSTSIPTTFGLIHFDFELDNLCWQEDGVGILDFDDCAYDWYAADIVFALEALLEKDDDVNHPLFQSFVEGYREYASFDPAIYSQVPMFRRMGALISYAKLVRAIDVPDEEAAPEWFQSLHAKLTDCVVSYRTSLEQRGL
ncbi:phosphotransferase enzyme family protein [Alicyclobacillus fodiniaquatilis]|uniref:Phosphotransferase enzyme family protein n=1 Tax=Alicyclobacillus fodiniaquatilis TaxID=1661150 RepID=A0ABW4JIY7_9BACL